MSKSKPTAGRRLLSLSEESYDFLFDELLNPHYALFSRRKANKLRADILEVGPDQRQAAKSQGFREPSAMLRKVAESKALGPLVCEGPGPHTGRISKLVPYSSDGNMILCRRCFIREMAQRRIDNSYRRPQDRRSIPTWASLKPYNP